MNNPKERAMLAVATLVFVELSGLLRDMTDDLQHAMAAAGVPINTMLDLHVMLALFRAGEPMKATDLAVAVGQLPTSFTPVLDRLEKLELIKRLPHPTDRRALLIALDSNGLCLKEPLEAIGTKLDSSYRRKVEIAFGQRESI